MRSIGLFGGTFDPVHFGHLGLARAAISQLDLEKLLLLPSGNPYQKGRLPLGSGQDRVNMLKLAFQEDAEIHVDERELLRAGPTYTLDTLVELRAEYGDAASLIWLTGSDAFSRLDTWHRWQELFGLAHFAVIDRPDQRLATTHRSPALQREVDSRLSDLLDIHQSSSGAVVILGVAPPPVSSTEIRQKISHHESVRGLTPDTVCDYIDQHRLYQPKE